MSGLAHLEAAFGREPAGPANRVLVARVDSTNRLARRVVATYQADEVPPPPFLVVATEQAAGRGRQGRAWLSPPNAGVYATWVLPVPEEGAPEALRSLPLLAGVGLARALNRMLAAASASGRCTLKWPNDLLLDGAKVGGILAESLALGSAPPVALVGFGVNYGRPHRGPELPPGATTFGDHAPSAASGLGPFTRELVAGLEEELAHLGDLAYATAAYRELSAHRPGDRLRCRSGNDVVEGTFAGFDEEGHLELVRNGETVRLSAGEIVENTSS